MKNLGLTILQVVVAGLAVWGCIKLAQIHELWIWTGSTADANPFQPGFAIPFVAIAIILYCQLEKNDTEKKETPS